MFFALSSKTLVFASNIWSRTFSQSTKANLMQTPTIRNNVRAFKLDAPKAIYSVLLCFGKPLNKLKVPLPWTTYPLVYDFNPRNFKSLSLMKRLIKNTHFTCIIFWNCDIVTTWLKFHVLESVLSYVWRICLEKSCCCKWVEEFPSNPFLFFV